jgi:hypothetical protein
MMDNMWVRFTTDMAARVSGPMKFRLFLQPAMAAFFAIRAGLADAKAGRPPYFWDLVTSRSGREAIIKDGWKSVGHVFILAVVLDVVYQLYELHFVYVPQALVVAFILAIVPYLALRGIVTRLARTRLSKRPAQPHLPPVNPMTPANRHP